MPYRAVAKRPAARGVYDRYRVTVYRADVGGRHWAARTAFRSDGSANAVYPYSYNTNRNRTIVIPIYDDRASRTPRSRRADD